MTENTASRISSPRRRHPALWAAYDWFRRHTGLSALECFRLAEAESRANRWRLVIRSCGWDEQRHERLALFRQTYREDAPDGYDGPWEEANWEFKQIPGTEILKPPDERLRVTMASLMLMLGSKHLRPKTKFV